jgi:hypothetical protein
MLLLVSTPAPEPICGVGEAHLNPYHLDVPEIGDELATARALSHLAHTLLDTAAGDLAEVLHAAVKLEQ